MTLELYAKASGFSFLPSQFWAAMPYIMAVVVLAVMSARDVTGSEAPACLGRPFLPSKLKRMSNASKEKKMNMITRRNLMKTAAAGLALPALGRDAPSPPTRSRSASSISGRSATSAGPGRTTRAGKAMVDALKGQVVADYVENVKEDASAIPIIKDLAQQGNKLIFTDLLRLHGPDDRGRQAVPGRQVRALHRLQARRQRRHLQLALLSGPRGRSARSPA